MYQIALINTWWDMTSTDCRLWQSTQERENYFSSLMSSQGVSFSPLVNFEFTDNISPVIYYKTNTTNIPSMLRCNYAILTDGSYYRYFFCRVEHDSGSQVKLHLNLDDITTNYIQYKNTIMPCLIERCHLDRFNSDGSISTNTALLNSELSSLPQYHRDRREIFALIDYSAGSGINNYFEMYETKWVVIFLQANATVNQYLGTSLINDEFSYVDANSGFYLSDNISTGQYCLISPVTYTNGIMTIDGQPWISGSSLLYNLLNNGLAPYISSVKITPVNPLNAMYYINNTHYTYDGSILNIFSSSFNCNKYAIGSGNQYCVVLKYQTQTPKIFDYTLPPDVVFGDLPSNIINNSNDRMYNPKLNSEIARYIEISDYCGNSFRYDIQKLGKAQLRFLINETLSPELTKGYVRFDGTGWLYQAPSAINYQGLVYSNDTQIPYYTEALANFLANNRNFSQIQQTQRDYTWKNAGVDLVTATTRAVAGSFNAMGSASPLNPLAPIGGALATAANFVGDVNSIYGHARNDTWLNSMNEYYTLNNLKHAPMSLQNAQGAVVLNKQINGLNMWIDFYNYIDADSYKFNDYINLFGFSYGQKDSVANYDNKRIAWNYISADVNVITAPISNIEKDRLRARLKDIRFWNNDTPDFSQSNYERILTA